MTPMECFKEVAGLYSVDTSDDTAIDFFYEHTVRTYSQVEQQKIFDALLANDVSLLK